MPLHSYEQYIKDFGINRPPINIAKCKRVIPVVLSAKALAETKWDEDFTLDHLGEIPGIDFNENKYLMVLTYFGASNGEGNVHVSDELCMRLNLFPSDSTLVPRNATATTNIAADGRNPLAAIFTWHIRSFSALPEGSCALTGTSIPFLLNDYPGPTFFSGGFTLNMQLRNPDQFGMHSTGDYGNRPFTAVFQIYEVAKE